MKIPKCKLGKGNIEMIEKFCRNVARLEGDIPNKELQQLIYNLGVYTFRNSFNADPAADIRYPGLTEAKKVWVKEEMKFVDERELVKPAEPVAA